MENEKIDFVILWVDGNDENWRKEKEKYEQNTNTSEENIDKREIRYRDWDNLQYWFRGIEKFAPWVNKIHFITCGHLPKWLNTNHPKLHIVKHLDYMPKDCLPTFNSNAIELLIHKIEGLEEKFVLFNDDLFITKKVKPTDFFKKGKPCNTMAFTSIIPIANQKHYKTVSNNMEIINRNFNFKQSVKRNLGKYVSLKQRRYILKTYPLFIYNKFVGFSNFHLPLSYLKTTFKEVWSKEESILNDTIHSRFRNYEQNVNHWLFNYWQFASGNFHQKSLKFGINILINDKKVPTLIRKQKYKVLGLGDSEQIENFEEVKRKIIENFEKILPEKSNYEQ